MEINKKSVDNVTILYFTGNFNLIFSSYIKQTLFDELNNEKDIILNLKATEFVDSTGVGLLVEMANKFRDKGLKFILTNMNYEVQNILNVANLLDMLQNFEDEEEALNYLKSK